jgi:uncharacterized membrane protein (UPF0127 family)
VVIAVAALAGLVVLGLGSCSSEQDRPADTTTTQEAQRLVVPDPSTGTTAVLGPGGLGVGVGDAVGGRRPLAGFGEVQATITSGDGDRCVVCLLSATTDEQRARGLMEVTDRSLGGYDGMLFEFPGEVDGAFWMRNTPLPLQIAYFDDRGGLVSTTEMDPCGDRADCPNYRADAPFAFALEVPQGELAALEFDGDATLVIDARTCDPLENAG